MREGILAFNRPTARLTLLWVGALLLLVACDDPAAAPDAGRDTGVIADAGFLDAALDAGSQDALPEDTGAMDAAPADAGFMDAEPDDVGFLDAEPEDAGFLDAEPQDALPPDAEPDDAGFLDAEPLDAEPQDALPEDAAAPDAGPADTGVVDAGPMICTTQPDSCAPTGVCLGESCGCILEMSGVHYLRVDGTVVNSANTPTVITTTAGVTLAGLTQVYTGQHHGCARRDDGTVWCWPISSLGSAAGQLGDGVVTGNLPNARFNRATEVLVGPGAPLTGVVAITQDSARGYLASNTCAVLANGELHCWGSPDSSGGGGGTLYNDGVAGSRPYAVPILAAVGVRLTGVQAVSQGTRHACVLRTGAGPGEVWCWGANIGGPLGQGDQTGRTYPVQAPLPAPADQVGAGADATCARVGDTVYCWGSNNSGQVGIGPHTLPANHDGCINYCKLTPTQVVDGTGAPISGVVDYEMAYLVSCARRADNAVWCWGSGSGDWASPAAVFGRALDNTARFTSSGSSGYPGILRELTRDNLLYEGNLLETPLCP